MKTTYSCQEFVIITKQCDGRHTFGCDARHSHFKVWRASHPFSIWVLIGNGLPFTCGNGTTEIRILSSYWNQLKLWRSDKKYAWKKPLHFFNKTWLFHFWHEFSISLLCFNLKGRTLRKMDNLPLQTMSFGFLILLLGAEKLSFESVSNVLGHTVNTTRYWITSRLFISSYF